MQNAELIAILVDVLNDTPHQDDCTTRLSFSNPASDFCSCGLVEKRKRIRRKIEELEAQVVR